MNANVACFFMFCSDKTEGECIQKGLFGDREFRLSFLKSVKKGDIGFLWNVQSDWLLGVFQAEGPAQLNIDPDAWEGVVFLDEAEWILCKREEQSSSVMQRITPVLLSQLGKIFKQRDKAIITVAATNKPKMLDPAFLRPGRFDKIFYVGLPGEEARKRIIELQLKGRRHHVKDTDVSELARKLDGYSGADIQGIIDDAAFEAYNRKGGIDGITTADIETQIKKTTPSVLSKEIEEYKTWAKERGIPVDG